MEIVVPIRTVTQPSSTEPDQRSLNTWDLGALEAGAAVATAQKSISLTVIVIGPPAVEPLLTKVLPAGIDEIRRLWDETLEELSPVDVAQHRQVLAAAIATRKPSLVCFGVRRSDYRLESTGVAVARELGYTWSTVVTDITLQGETVTLYREIENGYEIQSELPLPAVVTFYKEPAWTATKAEDSQPEVPPIEALDMAALDVSIPEPAVTVTEGKAHDEAPAFRGESLTETVGHLQSVLTEAGVLGDE